jgi:PKD repeat protein
MNIDGKSAVQSDEQIQAYEFKSVANYEHTLVWINASTPDLHESKDLIAIPTPSFQDPGH